MAAIEVKVPDIGDFKDVPVIEVLVKPGDAVKKDDSLLTLESDKATMEVPAPSAGTVKDVLVKVGDKVSEGVAILTLESAGAAPAASKPAQAAPTPAAAKAAPAAAPPAKPPAPAPAAAAPSAPPSPAPAPAVAAAAQPEAPAASGTPAHASPGVRRFARELGVDVARVAGSGPKGRILKEDIQNFVKSALSSGGGAP
ncbi:MAG: biotin/lipoyl-containing protein, partial [Usitatibacter sp.]